MKFSRYGSKLINFAAITHVDLNLPSVESDNDWIELTVCFIGGTSTAFYSDEALALWKHLQLYSINLTPPQIQQAS